MNYYYSDNRFVPVRPELQERIRKMWEENKSYDQILRHFNAGISKDKTASREQLLNRQDIENAVARLIKNNSIRRDDDDLVSISRIYEEFKDNPDSPFIAFDAENAFIVLMTPHQRDQLRKHGHKIVFVDGTHRTASKWKMTLVTLSVLNHEGAAVPVAFGILPSEGEEDLKKMFVAIRQCLGSQMPVTDVLMSDMAQSMFNAWSSSMPMMKIDGTQTVWRWCAWHLKKAWATNAQKKLKDKSKESDILATLDSAMECNHDSPEEHERIILTLKTLMDWLRDEDESEFLRYFEDQYFGKDGAKMVYWCGMFRVNTLAHTNTAAEVFHSYIKKVVLKGKLALINY